MLLLMVSGALLIGGSAAALYLRSAQELASGEQRQAELAAALVAGGFSQWIAHQAVMADRVAQDKGIVQLSLKGDQRARDKKAASLIYLFPAASRVRLLRPSIEEVDLKAHPPLSYAALDLLKYAETRDSPPPVEVHMSGTPEQHISLVRRIPATDGRGSAGNLMVSYPMDRLQELLALARIEGYAELQQRAGAEILVLASRGNPAFKRGVAASLLPVAGSRWQVAYWSPDVSARRAMLMSAGIAAAAAVLLAVIVWVAFRRLATALTHDQDVLLRVVRDAAGKHRQGAYTGALQEMRDIIEIMSRAVSAGPGKSRRTGSGRAVAGDGNAEAAQDNDDGRVVDEVERDLLFDDNALEISKVDVVESRVDPAIFRAYDIRGIVGRSLTDDVAFEIGRAIGSEAYFRGEQTVVVGRDGRLSGPHLTEALIRGLMSTGRDVKDVGLVPTPVLYFAAQHLGTNSGVMVTGSHNPVDYNGFKVVLAGETLSTAAIDGLRQRIESDDMLAGEGSVEQVDVVPDYVERVTSDVQIVRPMKVVVDCGNGAAAAAAPKLLEALGCEVVELFCEVDGNFPNHHPDPGKTENLADLVRAVQATDAELGIAFDGDGDRLGVVSSKGEIIWPDRVLMLMAIDVLSRHPGAPILYDVKSSRHVASVITEHGGEPLICATGHSLIKARMKETGALLAGEMSGHIFFKERWYGFDDGLYSAARLLELLANDTRSSSELFAELPDSVNTPELHIPMAEGEPEDFMKKLLDSARFDNASVETIDGMRVEFERGWGLVRASNTVPHLTLRFEADDELALSAIQDEFRRVMLAVNPRLSLPF
jgi:phosphomannomutase/phosphoglucomutase